MANWESLEHKFFSLHDENEESDFAGRDGSVTVGDSEAADAATENRSSPFASRDTNPVDGTLIGALGQVVRAAGEWEPNEAAAIMQAQPTKTEITSMPLRQWIQQVLQLFDMSKSAAIASPTYVDAAVRIAKFLAEQIRQAESLPISNGSDWAGSAVVYLECSGGNVQQDPTPKHLPAAVHRPQGISAVSDLDQQVESFLASFDTRDVDKKQSALVCGNTSPESLENNAGNSQDLSADLVALMNLMEKNEAAKERCLNPIGLKSVDGDQDPPVRSTIPQFSSQLPGKGEVPTPKLFSIMGAEIKCSEGEPRNYCASESSSSGEALQRMYYFGFLLYELYSGGERAPSKLCDLALTSGAFSSLSKMTLVHNRNEEEQMCTVENKRHQGPIEKEENGLCRVFCEYLQLIGVATPLCALVCNLLEPVYGDFAGNECYVQMDEVITDLQLMIDKPRFRRGLDMNNLPPDLPLGELKIPRIKEFQSIESSYRRSIAGSSELCVISGVSGTGKSALSYRLGDIIKAEGGIFLAGKFDQLMQDRPFSALSAALEQYCDLLSRETDADWAKWIADRLFADMGQDVCLLVRAFPKLALIFDGSTLQHTPVIDNYRNAVERAQYLLCRFIDVIASNSKVSLSIFIDDVQWADQASITVLSRLALQKQKKFFLICCYRDDEVSHGHPFCEMLNAMLTDVSRVKLNNCEEDVINDALSELFCLPPRLTKPLGKIVYTRTRGNLLFIHQLLLSLHRDGLLKIDFASKRWTWCEQKILDTKLPANVATCFAKSINELPVEVQIALHTMSTFGASVKLKYLHMLDDEFMLNITNSLKLAETTGLVASAKDAYHFSHDVIQAASYDLIGDQDRRNNHITYGRFFAKLAQESTDGELLFVAANQINLGGVNAVPQDELVFMADHNLRAGRKAVDMSDFYSAFSLFKHAIDFIRAVPGFWNVHYQFSLNLFELTCEAALPSGHLSVAHSLSDETVQNAKCFEDTLNVTFAKLSALGIEAKYTEALDISLSVLSQLGEAIPTNLLENEMGQMISQTQALIRGVGEDDILNHRIMTDTKKMMAMKILGQLQVIALSVRPSLNPLMIMKMVQLTMLHGISPPASSGFCYFGTYLGHLGSIHVGHRFAQLGRSIAMKLSARQEMGAVLLVLAEIKSFVEPAFAAAELYREGESIALSCGDSFWVAGNRLQHATNIFWCAPHLSIVKKVLTEAHEFLEKRDPARLGFILAYQQSLNKLLSGCRNDAGNEQSIFIGQSTTKNDARIGMNLAFHKLYISFLFMTDDIQGHCENYLSIESDTMERMLIFGVTMKTFVSGLGCYHIHRETRDPLWLERGKARKEKMRHYSEEGCKYNFLQKYLLMQAEESYCIGDYNVAREYYKTAIATCQTHQSCQDEALACELAGRHYLNTGDTNTSLEYFSTAEIKYREFGAEGKANDVGNTIRSVLRDVVLGSQS